MLSSILFTCRRAGYEEKQQAALWLVGEQPVVYPVFPAGACACPGFPYPAIGFVPRHHVYPKKSLTLTIR